MKYLQDTFTKRGFNYQLIQKNDNAFLYSISDGKDLRGYEVWKKKISKPVTAIMGGIEIDFEEAEMFPSNNNFGAWAWSYITLPFAMKRFQSLC